MSSVTSPIPSCRRGNKKRSPRGGIKSYLQEKVISRRGNKETSTNIIITINKKDNESI
jgi:hypothetical protein